MKKSHMTLWYDPIANGFWTFYRHCITKMWIVDDGIYECPETESTARAIKRDSIYIGRIK